jgi:hypothetical protein
MIYIGIHVVMLVEGFPSFPYDRRSGTLSPLWSLLAAGVR